MVVVPLSNGGRLLGTYNLFLPEAFELPEEVALLWADKITSGAWPLPE